MSAPLAGLRILDLTRILAGPWATQMLGDMGAEVIKIEKPGEGDDTRGWGPPFLTAADGSKSDSAYFLSCNRSKQSVALDLSKPEGQALVRQLVAQCDVLIENFKVGGLARYGLDYANLKHAKPGLIYCSISGFGQTGPAADHPGYDAVIQGMSGIMSITGEPDGLPTKMGVAFSDIFSGLHAVIGILAALRHRDQTGEGQAIDISLLDCQMSVLANQAMNWLVGGTVPGRLGSAHPNIVPYQPFATADGHVTVAVGNDRQFQDFCTILKAPELKDNPLYATNGGRVAHRTVLVAEIAAHMTTKTTAHWMEAMKGANVPCGPIYTIDQAFAQPQIKARGLERTLERSDGTRVPSVANPIVFSATPAACTTAPPRLGENTHDVLQRVLGLDDAEIALLRNSGTIGASVQA